MKMASFHGDFHSSDFMVMLRMLPSAVRFVLICFTDYYDALRYYFSMMDSILRFLDALLVSLIVAFEIFHFSFQCV